MQTIEAAVLVPLGLGLLVLLMMLTFYLHDQTVLAADYGVMLLEWQRDPNETINDKEELEEQLQKGNLITKVSLTEVSFGKLLGRIESEETWQVFEQGVKLVSLGEIDEVKNRRVTWMRLDACWLKRIWRASELG